MSIALKSLYFSEYALTLLRMIYLPSRKAMQAPIQAPGKTDAVPIVSATA